MDEKSIRMEEMWKLFVILFCLMYQIDAVSSSITNSGILSSTSGATIASHSTNTYALSSSFQNLDTADISTAEIPSTYGKS